MPPKKGRQRKGMDRKREEWRNKSLIDCLCFYLEKFSNGTVILIRVNIKFIMQTEIFLKIRL